MIHDIHDEPWFFEKLLEISHGDVFMLFSGDGDQAEGAGEHRGCAGCAGEESILKLLFESF